MEERLAASVLSRDEVIKHWLLNSAIDFPVRLRLLFPSFRTQALNLKEIPGARGEDYARNLLELFDAGMITFCSDLKEDDTANRSGVSRILDRFLALPEDFQQVRYLTRGDNPTPRPNFSPALQVSFALTARGGGAWEKLAEPEWGRFLSAYTTCPAAGEEGPMIGELVSPDRDVLMAFMGWYPQVQHESIELETVKWEVRSDYDVLYWKHLPFTHRVTFQVQNSEWHWNHYDTPEWFHDWWTRSIYWYKRPWELPDWPS